MRRRSYMLALVVLFCGSCLRLQAQDTLMQHYAKEISEAGLKENLTILASDFMEGRETGKRGQRMAASFIRAHFSDNNLLAPVAGDYLQPLELYRVTAGETYVQAGKTRLENYKDVAFFGMEDSGGEMNMPILFVGYGEESVYQQLDVRDKAVLLLSKNTWVGGSKEVMLARDRGAKAVFVCNTETEAEFTRVLAQGKRYVERGRLSLEKPNTSEHVRPGTFVVSPHAAGVIMGTTLSGLKSAAEKKSLKKIKSASIQFRTSIEVASVPTENVLGLVEGTDKKNEILLVTAHYDHVGIKQDGTGDVIHNGADDDGSGTVAVMELARVFAKARREGHGPRRSILFMLVTGEESGLLGSEFYAEHPVFSLESTVADLNIDMIGRRDPKHQTGNPYLYVIGADKLSSELNAISERMNSTYSKLDFDYTYNDPSHPDRLYYRSDHWNFAKRNVPIIFYFDGIHEDYHKVTDEVSKIDFPLLRQRAQCVFYTAWELSNIEKRIVNDKTSN
ncbi:M28 family peptidase [Chryseolinea sp. T2]|uniref:M28 family peptidase n=1 Tax=Chryseolinea sp. T2 TaxID=3129255 RepID=UPI003077C845